MTDDENAPSEPDPAAAETEPTPSVDDAAEETEAAPAATAEPITGWRRSVFVPAWVIAAVALLAVGGLAFGIGRWTAPNDAGAQPGEIAIESGEPPFEDLPDGIPRPDAGPVLGVSVEDATDPDGAEIVRVLADSPAADAGLEVGDVITAVDGDGVSSAAQLVERIRSHDRGDEVTVTYTRSGASDEVEVELGGRSAEGADSSVVR